MPCGVWGLPCGDWIAAVVTAQWLMFEERGLLAGGGLPCGWWGCLEGLGWVPALRVRVVGCPEGMVGLPCGDIRPYSCISAL